MSTTIAKLYAEARASSPYMNASHSLRDARIRFLFGKAENAGLVKLAWVLDEFTTAPDVFLDFDDYTKTKQRYCIEVIEREGVWGLVGLYRRTPATGDFDNGESITELERQGWKVAESVWGFFGQNESGYATQMQADALAALKQNLKERCSCCRE